MTSIVFFGTGPVAAASLDFLRSKFDIEAIITKPRVAGFKGESPVEELAKQHSIPLHFAENRSQLDTLFHNDQFKSSVGIVVDFGIIISKDVIDHFEKGIVNSHFSLLPRWRGADPISYTILFGDPKGGVSLMVINEGLDTGKLITHKSLAVDPKETTGSLTAKLIALSNDLFESYLPGYLSGEIKPKNQPHPDRATYSHKIFKADSIIDWNESADVIERKIRAYQPWPQSRTTIGNTTVIVIDAVAVWHGNDLAPGELKIPAEKNPQTIIVGTSDGDIQIMSLKPLGKKEMPVSAFLAGYRHQLDA